MRLLILSFLVSAGCGGSEAPPQPRSTPATTVASETQAPQPEPPPAEQPEGLLAAGAVAPDFSVPDQTGTPRSLQEFRGKPVVLYFYPRDATPGCTREACEFRDAWSRFEAAGAQVLGVSTDSVESHRAFAEEEHLPFPLLADVDGRILALYGVGSHMGFADRVTFVIGGDGRIMRVYPDVDPATHAEEVLGAIGAVPPPSTPPHANGAPS